MCALATRASYSLPRPFATRVRRLSTFFSLPLFLALCASSHATVYVRHGGSDGAGGRTWAAAKATVQAGVNAAAPGEEVWVAEGTYTETVTLPAGAALYGGFAGTETARDQRDWVARPTILDADREGSVVLISGTEAAITVVDGFTLRRGAAFSGSNGEPDSVGAGVAVLSGRAIIANNTIEENRGGLGGGILCVNATATIIGNTIARNSGTPGGGIYCEQAEVTATGNTIRENVGHVTGIYGPNNGNGVYCVGGDVTLEENLVTRNGRPEFSGDPGGGVGVMLTGAGVFTLRRNTIAQNFDEGVVVNRAGTASLSSNVVTGNGDHGVFIRDTSATLTNNTISGNNGGVSLAEGKASITNTLVAFNGGSGISNSASYPAQLTLSHNNVYGHTDSNYAGVPDATGAAGNISADPLLSSIFTRPHLQPGSPCLDAGDDTAVDAGETDMDGQPRIQGAHVDIGADESDGTAWPPVGRILHVRPGGDDAGDGFTWPAAKKTVSGALAVAEGDDEIWVAEGTYTENVIVPAGVSVYGGFAGSEMAHEARDWAAHRTVLSGGGRQRVILAMGQRIRVDGFTIQNGYTEDAGSGGGVAGSGSLTLANNIITQNSTGSSARGGGDGGGVNAYGTLTLLNNVISNNHAYHGGGVAVYGDATVIGNTIVHNGSGQEGGGVYASGTLTMSNTIIAFNSAIFSGAGLYYTNISDGLTLSHNDFFANGQGAGSVPDHTGTSGNVSVDPQFIQGDGNFRLAPTSPLIDAGDDGAVGAGERDLDGQPRIQGLHVDIGAYEFPAPTPVFTMKDVADSLKIAGGLMSGGETALNIVEPGSSGIDIRDAAALARNAAGLDPNP